MEKTAPYKKTIFFASLFVIPTIICFAFYYFIVRKPLVNSDTTMFKKLPIYGKKDVIKKQMNGLDVIDTVYHTIPAFSFINQDGEVYSDKNLEGKMYVADFFFTNCKTICPRMATNLIIAQKKLNYLKKHFAIVSFTVDPERDTQEELKKYAWRVHSQKKIWNFCTGKKEELYKLALEGFLLNGLQDTLQNGLPDFIHSEKLVLIDTDKRIRGFYDGTSTADVGRLIDEVKVLQIETRKKYKNAQQR